MKKVLLVMPLSTLEWGSNNSGGVDSVCQMLVKHLVAHRSEKFHYRILAFDPFSTMQYTGEVQQFSENVEVVVCPANERIGSIFKIPGILSQLMRVKYEAKRYSPLIVHAHAASWLLMLPKCYYRIATMHSYKNIGRKSVSWANDLLYVRIVPIFSQMFIDHYTCVGEMLYKAVLEDISKPVTIIGNPIDSDYFVKKKHKSNSVLTLITCALITKRKRVERCIELTANLKNSGRLVRLVIIGPEIDKPYCENLKKMIARLGLIKDVCFLGRLNKSEIITQYCMADVGVYYSDEETFGLAPLEMIAAGLPLLTTEVGILAERKTEFEQVGVEFIRTSAQDILAIDRLLGVDSTVASKYVADNFLTSTVVCKYESLYEERL